MGKKLVIFLKCFLAIEVLFLIFMVGGLVYSNPYEEMIRNNTYQDISEVSMFPIMENVEIESPSLIIIVDTFDEFIGYCIGEQVYKQDDSYYIFNSDKSVAYRYNVSWTFDWLFFNIERK